MGTRIVTTMHEEKYPKKAIMIAVITGIFVSLIPLFLSQQASVLASLLTSLLMFIWYCLIFTWGIPSIRNELRSLLSSKTVCTIFLLDLFIPYLLLLFFGLSFDSLLPFALWYILPSILLIPLILKEGDLNLKTRFATTIIAAVLYWIGFDHRYTMMLFDVFEGMSYIMNGFWFVSLIMISYGSVYGIRYQNDNPDQGLKPTILGLKYGQIGAVAASIIIVPVGLMTGFLSWNPTWPGITDFIIGFIGIYLTIALQEEIVFRGVILHEVDQFALPRGVNSTLTLLIVSFAFGLTHWNNEIPKYVPHYIILATIAGIAYGWAYRKSGIFGSMVAHTLIDFTWNLFLQRI